MRSIVDELDRILRILAPSFPPIRHDDKWLVALCHNDLGRSNLLTGRDGRLWLLDWENAGVVPVFADLGRLYLDHPHLKETLLDVLRSLDPGRETLPPVHQLALGAAFEVERRRRLKQVTVGDAMRSEGKSSAEAIADYGRALGDARRIVASLQADAT